MPEEAIVEQQPEIVTPPVSMLDSTLWKDAPTVVEVKEEVKPEPVKEEVVTVTPEVKEVVKVEEKVVVPEPLKFENAESEKVFNLLKEGKHTDVYNILHEQKVLGELDKMKPEDVIKLNLKYSNKDFSGDDINELFNERYEMPEKPLRDDLDTDEEFKAKCDKYDRAVEKVESKIKRDSKPAITELQKLKQEIVLPDIPKETPKQAEPTQEELEGLQKAKEAFFKTVDESAKTFNGFKTTFKDKEVEIEAAYSVTDEQKKSVNPLIESAYSDLPKFFNELGWISEDGKVNPKMIEDLHLIQNKESVFSKLVSEVGNKRHEAAIKSIKNIDYTGNAKSNGDLGASPLELQGAMANHFFKQ